MQKQSPINFFIRIWRWIVFFVALFWSFLSTSLGWQSRPILVLTTPKPFKPLRSHAIYNEPTKPSAFVIEDDLDTWFENIMLNETDPNGLNNFVYASLINQLHTEFNDHPSNEKEPIQYKLVLLNLNHNLNRIQILNLNDDSDDELENDCMSSENSGLETSESSFESNATLEECMEKTACELDQWILDANNEDEEPSQEINLEQEHENPLMPFDQNTLRLAIFKKLKDFQDQSSTLLLDNHFNGSHLEQLKSTLKLHDSALYDALESSIIKGLQKPQQSTLTANCL